MASVKVKALFHLYEDHKNEFELFRLKAIKNFFVAVEPLDKDKNFSIEGGALSVIGAANHAGLMGLSLICKLCETK